MQLAALQMDLDDARTDAAAERGVYEAKLRDCQAQLAQHQALLAERDVQIAGMTAQNAVKDGQAAQLVATGSVKRDASGQDPPVSPRISAVGRASRVSNLLFWAH